MKKKEIQEIYDLFIKCLPKNCVKPEIFKIYSSWRKMIEVEWPDFDKKNLLNGVSVGDVYSKIKRLYEIHGGYAWCRSDFYDYGIVALCKVAIRRISLYSRCYHSDICLIADLLHEVGHLNANYPPYIEKYINKEKAAEEWMWNRWPYVYGKYKKLKGLTSSGKSAII